MSESETQRAILLALTSVPGCRMFRNSVGVAREGNRVTRYGLCVGSSDLIGWYRGRFVAIEVKSATGRTTIEQDRFLDAVWRDGGLAGVCRSVEDALEVLR